MGLKSDLLRDHTSTIDPNLISQLVSLFSIRHFQVDAFSEIGVEEMQTIYKLLLQQYYPADTTEIKSRPSTLILDGIDCNTTSGFVYAPTRNSSLTTTTDSVTSGSEADPDKTDENNHHGNIIAFPHMTTNKRGTFPPHLNNSRRGSKDSR